VDSKHYLPRAASVVTVEPKSEEEEENEEANKEPKPEPAAEAHERGVFLCIETKCTTIPYDGGAITDPRQRLSRHATFTRVLQFERVIPPGELPEGLNYASVHIQVPPPDEPAIMPCDIYICRTQVRQNRVEDGKNGRRKEVRVRINFLGRCNAVNRPGYDVNTQFEKKRSYVSILI
jgi:hypothetical protein